MASGKDRILSQGPQRKVLTEEQTTRSVVVTRISHQTSDSAIVIYFQQAQNGGGELDHVHIPQKGKAVITFANIQVAEEILKHPHEIDGSVLKIHRLANKDPVFQRVEARLDLDPLRSFEKSRQNMIDALKEIEVEFREISHNAVILSGSLSQVRRAQDKLRQDASGVKEGNDVTDDFLSESTNIFVVQPQFMKLLKLVHKKTLSDMEHKFGVQIVWEENASQVCVRQGKTSKGNHRLKEGCEEFIDLYKNFHPKVSREAVQLPSEVEETVVHETIMSFQKENPVIFEKAENNIFLYADKDSIRSYVRSLEERFGFTLRSSRTGKLTSQGTFQDQKNQRLQSFAGSKPLVQVLKNGVRLSLYQGDVTDLRVDAIVNAANERLLHGGGVARAIVRNGGFQIQDESNKITRSRGWLNVGEAVETSGGDLPCRYVIHAVGPRWNEHGKEASKSLLRQACLASLNLAALKLQLSSIALTAISSGIFGMPKDICAQVIFKAVEEFSESPNAEFSTLRDVRIVIIDEPTIRVFSEEFIKRYNLNEESPGIVFKPERPLEEGGQTSMATSPTKENNLLPSADKEMSLLGEEDMKNARSESSLNAESRPKVDSSSIKSSCSGNNNVTGKLPRGRGRGLLAVSGMSSSLNSLFDGKNAGGERGVSTQNANTGFPAPGLVVTEEGKKLAKKLKGGVEDDNSADVTEPVKNITESSGPKPQDVNHSHESHDKENTNRYGEIPNDGSSDGGQGNDITLKQSLFNHADTSSNDVRNDISVTEFNSGDLEHPKTSASENTIESSSSETRENVEEVCDKTTTDSKDSGINNVAKSVEHSQGMVDSSNPDGSIQRSPHHPTQTPSARENTISKNMQGGPNHAPQSDPGQVNEMSRGDQTKRPNCLLCDNFNAPLFPSPCRRDHYFCTSCYQALSARTEFCSQCKKEGLFQGNQQTGEMTWIADTEISLPGYDDCGVIMVQFSFDKGIQGPGSPNPGQPYNASTTTCYLPFNREGEEVCFLLKKAFEANLLFTIEEDKIVCNGIELITDRLKGNVNYENTDPGYLARIRGQLAKLGITVQQL
ncbi:uncharacterized protein [Montipora foliosa]|uniref:uncharacterized protein isoform X2 n=1 Tax=Montipora foliosa TaxID=591990 RepID=UPI0035F16C6F